jgi:hypothetical protein
MFAIPRLAIVVTVILLPHSDIQADPLPRFTEAREAAALHFVRKRCPELLPLLEDLKKTNRAEYELQIRETFQVTEWLADLQDDEKRYAIELRMWKAENKALVLVAKLASAKDDDRKLIEAQLRNLAKELVELDQQSLEHRVELLQGELAAAKEELAKTQDNHDRVVKSRYDSLLDRAKKKKP